MSAGPIQDVCAAHFIQRPESTRSTAGTREYFGGITGGINHGQHHRRTGDRTQAVRDHNGVIVAVHRQVCDGQRGAGLAGQRHSIGTPLVAERRRTARSHVQDLHGESGVEILGGRNLRDAGCRRRRSVVENETVRGNGVRRQIRSVDREIIHRAAPHVSHVAGVVSGFCAPCVIVSASHADRQRLGGARRCGSEADLLLGAQADAVGVAGHICSTLERERDVGALADQAARHEPDQLPGTCAGDLILVENVAVVVGEELVIVRRAGHAAR